MRLLLDTHTFLWWITDDGRLSGRARECIATPENELYLSAASGWEIAIKAGLGKLRLAEDLGGFIAEQLGLNSIQVLPVQMEHALRVHSLPALHRDPFDRLLVAQSQVEGLPIVSGDAQIAKYGVEMVW